MKKRMKRSSSKRNCKEQVCSFCNGASDNVSAVKKRMLTQLNSSLNRFEATVCSIIDDYVSIKDKKTRIKKVQAEIKASLPHELSQVTKGKIDIINLSHIPFVNIDFEGAIEELDFTIEDFEELARWIFITALIGAGIGMLNGGLIGAMIGVGIGTVLGGLICNSTGDARKNAKAKAEISNAIEKDKERILRNFKLKL